MKTTSKILGSITISLFAFFIFYSCSNNDGNIINNEELSQADKEALLFMLEEEKLARDTYNYLNDIWSLTSFSNIKESEQSHINAISKVLKDYNISYAILEYGKFENTDLQVMYNKLTTQGAVSVVEALKVGAFIEDLDIIDLQERIDATDNTSIINVFSSLQCGSRNHLRSFIKALTNNGGSYTPKYLSEEEFNQIISKKNEKCN